MFYSRNLNREFYSVKSFTYDKRRLYKTHTSLSPPDVGTQTRTPPSGGWSKDPSWLRSWCVRRLLKLLLHCYYIANGTHRHLFPTLLLVLDQFCSIYWNHHHPGSEAAVSWHWRKWVQHLPVSLHFYYEECTHATLFSSVKRQHIEIEWIIVNSRVHVDCKCI